MRFSDFYVAQPVCSASRAGLLTGCYPNRVGIHGALVPSSRVGISEAETTLAELLRDQGYATAIFGKWHLGCQTPFLPTRHGFERFYGIPYSNDMWPFHPEGPKPWVDLPTYEGEKVVALNGDQCRFTRDSTDRGIAFIEECAAAGRPFFLYLPHPMPHVPLHASEAFRGRSEQGLYGDVIEEIDDSVGRLLAALEETGTAENTLFLFTSDNGPWILYGNHAGSAGPFREAKGTTFEGGVRVPFLARWPGRIPAGAVQHEPAMTIDLLPTIARIVGAPLPPLPIDGLDILPLLECREGARSPHEWFAFYYRRNELQAMRVGRWKLHFPHTYRTLRGDFPGRDGMPGKYDYGARTGLELYDLESDPGESVDVAARHPEVVARIQAIAEAVRADLGDALTGVEGTGRREPGRVP